MVATLYIRRASRVISLLLMGSIVGGCASAGGPRLQSTGVGVSTQQGRSQADRLRRQGNFDEAIAVYESLLADSAGDSLRDAEVRHGLCQAYWGRATKTTDSLESNAGDRQKAIQIASDLLISLEARPQASSDRLYGIASRSLGRFLRSERRLGEALDVYERSLTRSDQKSADHVATLQAMGDAYFERSRQEAEGGVDAAKRDLDSALQCQKNALGASAKLDDCPISLQISIHHSLGSIHQRKSESESAAQSFTEAARLCREEDDSPQHAEVLASLVLVLLDAGRYDDVRSQCQALSALPGAERQPRIQVVLGVAALKLGDLEEANLKFDLARHLGRRDASCRDDLNFQTELAMNAAACAQELGAYGDAERYLESAQQALEAGKVDPRTAAVLKANLGRMFLTMERLDEAEVQLQGVLDEFEFMQDERHPDRLLILMDLANLARLRGHWQEATKLGEQAVAGLIATQGEAHPLVAQARLELAAVHREEGRCSQALELADQAMKALDAQLGSEHKDAVLACLQAALIAANCSDSSEGAAAFSRLKAEAGRRFKVLQDSLGQDNLEVLRAMVYFAEVTARTPSAYAVALQKFEVAEEGFRKHYPDGAPSLAALRLQQGQLLERMGKQDEAFRIYSRALRSLDAGLKRHPIRGALLAALGDIHHSRGESERANSRWREALGILTDTLGADHPRVLQFKKQRSGK